MDGGGDPRGKGKMAWPERPHDFHPLHNDMLFVADALAGILLGFASGFVYLRMLRLYRAVGCADVAALAGNDARQHCCGADHA
ncbi:MAG: hypothetical protein WDN04_15050 [Rhodospirillales bacterium]